MNRNFLFNKASASYYEYAHIQNQTYLELIKKSESQHPKRILDIGCATGENTLRLATQFPHAEIIGIDASEEMIAKAKRIHKKSSITFRCCQAEDCHHLGLFDLIVSNAVYQWMPSLESAFKSLLKSLSGYAHLAIYGPATYTELHQSLYYLNPSTSQIRSQQFPNIQDIEKSLARITGDFFIYQGFIRHRYPSLNALLKTIQKTGVSNQSPKGCWTVHKLKQLEVAYQKLYKGIWATYHIIYCDVFRS
jgi:malonyl-ACP O-methyltransferase BioC